jgi:hypothetical protein
MYSFYVLSSPGCEQTGTCIVSDANLFAGNGATYVKYLL